MAGVEIEQSFEELITIYLDRVIEVYKQKGTLNRNTPSDVIKEFGFDVTSTKFRKDLISCINRKISDGKCTHSELTGLFEILGDMPGEDMGGTVNGIRIDSGIRTEFVQPIRELRISLLKNLVTTDLPEKPSFENITLFREVLALYYRTSSEATAQKVEAQALSARYGGSQDHDFRSPHLATSSAFWADVRKFWREIQENIQKELSGLSQNTEVDQVVIPHSHDFVVEDETANLADVRTTIQNINIGQVGGSAIGSGENEGIDPTHSSVINRILGFLKIKK